jgi:molybdate transport system ATP-binding protein
MNPETKRDHAKPFLTLDHVTIRLRDRFVFEETSWQIRSDEHWAVIGANGAGKSKLLELITGENVQGYANEIISLAEEREAGRASGRSRRSSARSPRNSR